MSDNLPAIDDKTKCLIAPPLTSIESYINGIGGVNEASRKLDVDRKTVQRWLSGETSPPGLLKALMRSSDKNMELVRQLADARSGGL